VVSISSGFHFFLGVDSIGFADFYILLWRAAIKHIGYYLTSLCSWLFKLFYKIVFVSCLKTVCHCVGSFLLDFTSFFTQRCRSTLAYHVSTQSLRRIGKEDPSLYPYIMQSSADGSRFHRPSTPRQKYATPEIRCCFDWGIVSLFV